MALTYTELEAVTDAYFMADGRRAVDIYFDDCFLMDRFLKQKKGIWERPNGGERIKVPLMYDGQEAGFYTRGQALTSDDRENLQSAFFYWKHAFSNATIYRPDELKNSGEYAQVQMVETRLDGAQKSLRKKIADSIYAANSDTATEITGLRSCIFGTSGVAYGGIIDTDLVATDGSYPWNAVATTNTYTSSTALSLAYFRTIRSSAKIGNGKAGKPDIAVTTETLFNIISGILQAQQRFTEDKDTADAGFINLVFEGCIIAADDYCPSGYMVQLNSKHYGWAVHPDGYFVRTPWGDMTNGPNGIAGKTMKFFFDGNQLVNNRKAHTGHSALT